MSSQLDDQGRLPIPPETLAALGWEQDQPLELRVEGDILLVQPATEVTRIKDEARKLANAMRGFTLGAADRVKAAVDQFTGPTTAAPGAPPPIPTPTPNTPTLQHSNTPPEASIAPPLWDPG